MGDWYEIGVLAGVGVALGVLFVGMLAPLRLGAIVATAFAAAVAVAVGFGFEQWPEALAGGLGSICGTGGARQVVVGALRRGGTRGGTAALVGGAALALVGLAFVPALGYLEALALPALGARLRARTAPRFAGLRILARD